MIDLLNKLGNLLKFINEFSVDEINTISLELFHASLVPSILKYPNFDSAYLLARTEKINPINSDI